jgi:hypothetical protein
MAAKLIRILCFGIFLAGVPGIIVTSIVSNNNGGIVTIGMCMVAAAIVLITMSATSSSKRLDAFDEVAAERVENRVRSLVEAGADENDVRALIRDTIDLTRGHQ